MLNVTSLSKSYGSHEILHAITFTIHPGEIVGLVGENGAGKSTLLTIIATLSEPSAGTLSLHAKPYSKNIKKIRQKIGYVPQEIAIWEELTVQENMAFFEKLAPVNKTNSELEQICKDMNLNKWNEPAKRLSGGMKRKLNLAISLIQDPEVLLLDEPTVGIDLKSKNEIRTYIQQLAREKGTMILFTSHDMNEIMNVCSRIVCIGEDPFYHDLLVESGMNPQVL